MSLEQLLEETVVSLHFQEESRICLRQELAENATGTEE